ncbi:MAG TPA: spermidine/putrescine ABC transporter substrate-binding protein, partial [Thermoflexales bacterium]|nr:spermidine/putrescine ABC transporter substrate-binding protein [Thermoflexales bacterium]
GVGLAAAACAPAAAPTATSAPKPTAVPPTPAPTAAPTAAPAKPTDAPKATDAPKPTAVPPTAAPAKPTDIPKPADLVVDKTKLAKQLTIYTWDGYFDEAVLAGFEKEYGLKVKVETYDSNETMYNKFKAGGNPGYDLVVPSDYMVERLIREGLAQKIDFANVPNSVYIDPEHKNLYFDQTSEYSIAHNWGTTGVAYDSAKVKTPITTWKQVFEIDPALKGKLGMLDDPREPMCAALRYLNFNGSTTDLTQVEQAKQLLLKQKASVASYKYSSDYKKDLVAGDVIVAMMYSNDAVQAAKDLPSIKYVIPQGSSTIWQDNLVIPKGARSKYTAEVFINYMLRADVAAANANALGLSSSNLGSMAQGLIDKNLLNDPNIYPDDIPGLVKAGKLEWILHFTDAKVTAAYDKAYNAVLAE